MSMTIQQAIDQIAANYKVTTARYHQAICNGIYPEAEGYRRDIEAEQMALNALREKAERENPQPLTIEELLQMDGELVWFEVIDAKDYTVQKESSWAEVCIPTWERAVWFERFGNECEGKPKMENYGKTWIAYRHKPKEG